MLSAPFQAARDGRLDDLKAAVANGWDARTTDVHGSTALMWAAGGGHVGVCRFLVDTCGLSAGGEDASAVGKKQRKRLRSPLHWAARHGHAEVCRCARRRSLLARVPCDGVPDCEGVHRWLVEECGADVNVTTGDGTTPFHYAVWQGHLALCKWFVYQAACDWASLNDFGCNAIQWAAQTDDLDMCRWLAALGLDVAVVNNNGHSAVHKAANKGQARVCEWLLNEESLGLVHLQPDQDGNTPAVMARLEGHGALADALDAAAATLRAPETGRGPGAVQPGAAGQRHDRDGGAHVATDTAQGGAAEAPPPFRMAVERQNGVGESAGEGGALRRKGGIQKGSSVVHRAECVRHARLAQLQVRCCSCVFFS